MDVSNAIVAKSDQLEVWASVPGFEGAYEVSSLGRVRSLDRVTDRGRKWKGKLMSPSTMPRGYQVVTLWRDGKQETALVHRLVLFAFVGDAPAGMEALHGDGDPANNRRSNLSWGTHSENQYDQVAHGTHTKSSKMSCPSGHPYDEKNTYTYPGPRAHRGCRTCRREYMRRWHAEKQKAK